LPRRNAPSATKTTPSDRVERTIVATSVASAGAPAPSESAIAAEMTPSTTAVSIWTLAIAAG
jgi:hypothetical protein